MAETFDPQVNITTFWSSRASEYDAAAGHGLHTEEEHRVWLRTLGDLLPPAPADVLDLGCGTGFLAYLMAELGHRVVGYDLADGMLEQARAKAVGLASPPRFETGDAVAPPVADASVDAIASRHVLWTLIDPPRAFDNWRRALRPGGRVVAINGLWKDTNIATARREGAAACPYGAAALERHQRYYTPEVEARLPLMHAESEADFVVAFQQAGFVDVGVRQMLEVEAVEPVPEGGAPRARYVVVATRPG